MRLLLRVFNWFFPVVYQYAEHVNLYVRVSEESR